jgi:hypothetical protein
MGELVAWIIGWDLILEYLVSKYKLLWLKVLNSYYLTMFSYIINI